MKRVWPNSFVEEANLSVNISALRRALGDTADGQELIATVPKMGYRFVIPVREVRDVLQDKDEAAEQLGRVEVAETKLRRAMAVPTATALGSSSIATSQPRGRSLNKVRWTWLIAAIVITLSLLTYVGYRTRVVRHGSGQEPRNLAILPFQNLNKDPNSEFLGFSLADAVIIKLGNVSALSVRPSSAVQKYREQIIDIPKVAKELKVDTLLTGTFIHEGNDLRVTTQLIDAKKQNILWQDTFDLKYDKLLRVQDDVAQQIIKGLALNLSPSEAKRMQPEAPVNPLAYEYYLRGVDLYSRGEFAMAIKMLDASIQIDPNYALTWAQLGRTYTASASFRFGGQDHYQKAQVAFEKALSLRPLQIETRVYMANFLTDTGKAEEAVPLLREALKANPNHAEVHWELGYAYRFGGMLPESAAESERARALDPGVKLHTSALNAYLYLGQFDRFLASLPSDNNVAFDLFYRGFGEYYKGDWAAATRDFNRAYDMEPSLLQAQIGEALSAGIQHQESKGVALLRETEKKIAERRVRDSEALYKIAQAYARLGDRKSGLRVLASSVENGFFPYPYLASDPMLESLRHEKEFSEILEKARLRHEKFRQQYF